VYQPKCSDFPDQVSKDACYKVFACLMRTECWREGTLKCYCGNNTIADCKDGTANGECKKDIDEAFAAAPVDLVVTDPNAIVTNIGRVAIPAGAALSLAECQWKYCYDPSVTSGNWECDPAHQAGGTGGAGAGGAGTGGAGTGGAGTGGAGTGGTGTGGSAGTGGVGGSGGGSNGMSSCATATTCGEAGSPYDVHSPPCTPAGADCTACEAINCPHNTTSQPYCQDLNASADKSACQAVLDCARATNCIATGNVSCFCGADLSVPTCKANPIGGTGSTPGAHGPCVTQIQAAFPTNSTPAYIVDHIGTLRDATTTVVLPGGIALSLAQCDYNNCGDITGTNECVPYCR
jgi:hypothetical protein